MLSPADRSICTGMYYENKTKGRENNVGRSKIYLYIELQFDCKFLF